MHPHAVAHVPLRRPPRPPASARRRLRRRRAARLAATAGLLLAAACGAGPAAAPPSPAPPSVSAPAPTTASGEPVGSSGPRYPNVGRFTNALDRLAYRSAFDACAIAGAETLAADYGGSAADPGSVARAYARYANPSHQDASAQGCLDALQPAEPPT